MRAISTAERQNGSFKIKEERMKDNEKNDKWVCRGKEITPFFVSSCHVFFDGHNDCSEKGIID